MEIPPRLTREQSGKVHRCDICFRILQRERPPELTPASNCLCLSRAYSRKELAAIAGVSRTTLWRHCRKVKLSGQCPLLKGETSCVIAITEFLHPGK